MATRIAFINHKGGVGKTTCATLVAGAIKITGFPVSIEDRDPQFSATTAAGVFDLPTGNSGEFVIIDTAPHLDFPSTIDAIRTAHLVVLVTSPSPLDLATTAATAQRIQSVRKTGETRLLFNMVQTNNRFFDEMPRIAAELPFPVLNHYLLRRTSYQVAQLYGWKSMPAETREEVLKLTVEIVKLVFKAPADRQTV